MADDAIRIDTRIDTSSAEKDLEKLPENVRSAMQIQTISDASEAIATVMPGRKTTHVKAVI